MYVEMWHLLHPVRAGIRQHSISVPTRSFGNPKRLTYLTNRFHEPGDFRVTCRGGKVIEVHIWTFGNDQHMGGRLWVNVFECQSHSLIFKQMRGPRERGATVYRYSESLREGPRQPSGIIAVENPNMCR